MKSPLRFLILLLSIFVIAQRSPAPIVEPEEKPTPAPEHSEAPKPKTKRPSKSVATSEEEAPAKAEVRAKPAPPLAPKGPARFAGTWIGKVNFGVTRRWGILEYTLVFNSAGTSVLEKTATFGSHSYSVVRNGDSAQWGTPGQNWKLTPNSDGRTALVITSVFSSTTPRARTTLPTVIFRKTSP
jgi:hypothetical protein